MDFAAPPPPPPPPPRTGAQRRADRKARRAADGDAGCRVGDNFRVLPLDNPCLLAGYLSPVSALLVRRWLCCLTWNQRVMLVLPLDNPCLLAGYLSPVSALLVRRWLCSLAWNQTVMLVLPLDNPCLAAGYLSPVPALLVRRWLCSLAWLQAVMRLPYVCSQPRLALLCWRWRALSVPTACNALLLCFDTLGFLHVDDLIVSGGAQDNDACRASQTGLTSATFSASGTLLIYTVQTRVKVHAGYSSWHDQRHSPMQALHWGLAL